MSDSFAPIVHATRTALAESPDSCVLTVRASSREVAGLHREVRVREFTVAVDEPASLGGSDAAPNPVEYALAALATCQEITYRVHADALGIPLDDVSVTVEGDVDLRGFFGADDSVRPGFQAIRAHVSLSSSAPADDLARLREYVNAHCPVLDLFRAATPVSTLLEERQPAEA